MTSAAKCPHCEIAISASHALCPNCAHGIVELPADSVTAAGSKKNRG